MANARAARPAGAIGNSLATALLTAVVFWPYTAVDRPLSVAFLLFVSLVALAYRPLRLPHAAPAMVAFIALFWLAFTLDGATNGWGPYALSQSNHIVQFSVYYFAFLKICQTCDWRGLFTSRRFIAFGLVYSAIYYAVFNDIEINMALCVTIFGLFLRGTSAKRTFGPFAVLLGVAVCLALTSIRSSVLLVMVIVLAAYWAPPLTRRTAALASIVVLLAPLVFYRMLDVDALRWLYAFDHNTAIRAEFIRGASRLLEASPITGIGFGDAYRPTNFPYVGRHPYLTDPETVHIISNHHSLFDVALRLGIPAAVLFWWGMLGSRTAETNKRFYLLLLLIASVGMSFNAWFENQYQLPQFALTIALIQAGQRRTAKDVDQTGYSERTGAGPQSRAFQT